MTENTSVVDTNVEDLRTAYLQTFDSFAVVPSDIVEGNESINLRYARELLGTLVNAGLVVVNENGEGEDVWQTAPDTYDQITREEAEARFDAWLADGAEVEPETKAPAVMHGCYCGCGENVPAKSFYRPGHDARHAGIVGRTIAANYGTEGYDRREALAALPSDALVAKAEGIAEKAMEKADAKAKREAEKQAAKDAKASKATTPTEDPAEVDEGGDGTEAVENGVVKVGKNEYVAVRYTATGKVEYFKGDETVEASKTAAKTFAVA